MMIVLLQYNCITLHNAGLQQVCVCLQQSLGTYLEMHFQAALVLPGTEQLTGEGLQLKLQMLSSLSCFL